MTRCARGATMRPVVAGCAVRCFMGAARPLKPESMETVWDLLTVGVMLVVAALSLLWFLPRA